MEVLYSQINLSNIKLEKEYFTNIQNEGFIIIGIEVTQPELALYCTLNIDPQHDNISNFDMTSLEYIYNYRDTLISTCKIFDKILFTTVKPDIDSISSIALLELLLNDKFILDNNSILRLKAIAKSDRHGRSNYKNRKEDYFKIKEYNVYGIPIGLNTMTADYKLDIADKVENMKQYLLTGEFSNLKQYNTVTLKNISKSSKNTKSEVIIPGKLIFVKSNFRGAVAYGYKSASTVIAKNSTYSFGIGIDRKIGKKITIAQYEDNKFIDLIGLKNELNSIEPGWGGSSAIIGSPQDSPCTIDDDVIVRLTLKYLYG